MLTRIIVIIVGVTAVAFLSALASSSSDDAVSVGKSITNYPSGGLEISELAAKAASQPSPTPKQLHEIQIDEVLTRAEEIEYGSYRAVKRYKKLRDPDAARPVWIRGWYVVLERNGRTVMTFDANYYFGFAGNSSSLGLASLLGRPSKQLIVSQDVNRGGAQWIVDLSSSPRIIFSTSRWEVGREVYDIGIKDLDGDGVYEITLPITDFYALQDKMSMSQIPFPEIVFKYDRGTRKYLPANPLFQNYLLTERRDSSDIGTSDESNHRSLVLGSVLDLVYAGKRTEAWSHFDRVYKLKDKEEIRRRVKSLLSRQPTYNFIYTRRKQR